MNKRGDTQKILLYTFYLLMAFLIIYSSARYMSNYFNGLEFNKEFLIKDLGLAIDTLSFSPSTIEMRYNFTDEYILNNADEFNIKSKNLEISKQYSFISDIDGFSTTTREIIVEKKGSRIKVS